MSIRGLSPFRVVSAICKRSNEFITPPGSEKPLKLNIEAVDVETQVLGGKCETYSFLRDSVSIRSKAKTRYPRHLILSTIIADFAEGQWSLFLDMDPGRDSAIGGHKTDDAAGTILECIGFCINGTQAGFLVEVLEELGYFCERMRIADLISRFKKQ